MIQYSHLTVSEHRDLFPAAGFTDVEVLEEYDRGWLCASGRKRV